MVTGGFTSPHKGPVTQKMFLFDDVIMGAACSVVVVAICYIPMMVALQMITCKVKELSVP